MRRSACSPRSACATKAGVAITMRTFACSRSIASAGCAPHGPNAHDEPFADRYRRRGAQRRRRVDHDRSRKKAQCAVPVDARRACRGRHAARGRREHAVHRRARCRRTLFRRRRRHRRSRRGAHASADRSDDGPGDRGTGRGPALRGPGRRVLERRRAGGRRRTRGCVRHARRGAARTHRIHPCSARHHAGVGRCHRPVPARRAVAGRCG